MRVVAVPNKRRPGVGVRFVSLVLGSKSCVVCDRMQLYSTSAHREDVGIVFEAHLTLVEARY